MNPSIISKEQLLCAAQAIAQNEGLAKLNIRRLAADCGVAVGTIYNYFPSKDDLLTAIIADFWYQAAHGMDWAQEKPQVFIEFVPALYQRFYQYLQSFEKNWLAQITLAESLTQKAKAQEAVYFQHICRGLEIILTKDATIAPGIWHDALTPQTLAAFTFDNMLLGLRQERDNCDFLTLILTRLLRPES